MLVTFVNSLLASFFFSFGLCYVVVLCGIGRHENKVGWGCAEFFTLYIYYLFFKKKFSVVGRRCLGLGKKIIKNERIKIILYINRFTLLN